MLTTAGGALLAKRFWSAIKPPKVAVVPQDTSSMAALGAAALAHSTSRVASPSSPVIPGSMQLLGPLTGEGWLCVSEPFVYCDRPNVVRKFVQSSVL